MNQFVAWQESFGTLVYYACHFFSDHVQQGGRLFFDEEVLAG